MSAVLSHSVMVYLCVAMLFSNAGCGEAVRHRPLNEAQVKEQLMQYNRSRVAEEDSLIERFMRYHKLDFERSPTGLRYEITAAGAEALDDGDHVAVVHRIHLLDSTLCYENQSTAALQFVVNGSDVASGFHELVQLTGRGGAARSIWPARLGYGVAGDLSCIPLEAILLVDIEVR